MAPTMTNEQFALYIAEKTSRPFEVIEIADRYYKWLEDKKSKPAKIKFYKNNTKDGDKDFLEKLIGMSEDEAVALCSLFDYTVRVTMRNGNPYMITHDLKFDRVNLQIENDLIVKADIG